jgi:hypothetical protein
MNPRERILASGLVVVVVLVGGAFLFHRLFLVPLANRDTKIEQFQQEVDEKGERVNQILAEKAKLAKWRGLSLPADVDMARREYENYLTELLRDSGFAPATLTVTAKPVDTKSSPTISGRASGASSDAQAAQGGGARRGDLPVYTRLAYTVQGRADLAHFVRMLERFYRTPLLHQIKNLTIQRPLTPGSQQQGDLDVNMTVEALVVDGAEKRPTLLPGLDRRFVAVDVVTALGHGLAGLALVPWAVGPTGPVGPGTLAQRARDYAAIADKNIFFGNQRTVVQEKDTPLDPTRFVRLIDITHNDDRTQALLYDRYNNRYIRLRTDSGSGYDTFGIEDERGETALRGKVMRIDQRDLIFRVDDNYYSIHLEQDLVDALRTPLTAEQVQSLGLAAAPDKGPIGQ